MGKLFVYGYWSCESSNSVVRVNDCPPVSTNLRLSFFVTNIYVSVGSSTALRVNHLRRYYMTKTARRVRHLDSGIVLKPILGMFYAVCPHLVRQSPVAVFEGMLGQLCPAQY